MRNKTPFPAGPRPRKVLGCDEHKIRLNQLDYRVRQIIRRLAGKGYIAYIVGGGVRDLLLGKEPKDYDLVTSARPNRIKRLFQNAFLIGRRFRLVHIRYGDEFIEVATFRKEPDIPLPLLTGEKRPRHLRTYGTPRDDAYRRDFTVNALFFDGKTDTVIDYVGGLADLRDKKVVTVVSPASSISEDPVRMVRAVRLAGRHGFTIVPELRKVICARAGEIRSTPSARLLEEINVLLYHGAAAPSLQLLHKLGLLVHIFAPLALVMDDPKYNPLLQLLVAELDKGSKPPDETKAWTYLLLPVLLQRLGISLEDFYLRTYPLTVAREIEKFFPTLVNYLPLAKAMRARVSEIITTQTRFVGPRCFNNPDKILRRRSFAEILSLFELFTRLSKDGPAAAGAWQKRRADVTTKKMRKRRPSPDKLPG